MFQKNIIDKHGRLLEYLRISVTDRCNFRCSYCMPHEIFNHDYTFLSKNNLLSYEEIVRFSTILKNVGLKKIRLTGGEPLLRKNIDRLIYSLRERAQINEISLTTNGSLLNKSIAQDLKTSGLNSITISLDSINDFTLEKINTLKNNKSKILEAIDIAIKVFGSVKVNMVVIKDINDSEIIPMIEYLNDPRIQLRFIEFMDVGETNNWNIESVITANSMKKLINTKYTIEKMTDNANSTSQKYRIMEKDQEIAFIASVSEPFCGTCNRGRLSADGKFFTCLFSSLGYDFLNKLRNIDNDDEILSHFIKIWSTRIDKYSENRLQSGNHKRRNKIEMSYIGG
ncbi:MAG: GTP 3',8-cyclase MoaA [Gammaproteobacteria bacterium]|nr:GTP 3',8-cyclase MoaA [Gammaproteobacteria bacterium]